MTASIVTVKLPKDLYTRLDALAKQERTDVVDLLDRLATSLAARPSRLIRFGQAAESQASRC